MVVMLMRIMMTDHPMTKMTAVTVREEMTRAVMKYILMKLMYN